MRRILGFLIILTLLFIPCALADGGFFTRIDDKDIWRLFPEEQQYCAINYKDGVQRMILTVDLAEGLTSGKGVWLFPVPANPQQVDINVLKGFPALYGNDLEKNARSKLSSAFAAMVATQVYPFPFVLFYGVMSAGSFGGRNVLAVGKDGAGGVTVYERIEKMGLTTELVSASDANALSDYLTSKDLELPGDFKSILDEYIGQDYSFVISWISNIAEFKNAQMQSDEDYFFRRRIGGTVGVFIEFPSQKIYYPLKPTSVYRDEIVPVIIYVIGYVQPDLFEGIKKEAEVNYFFQGYHQVPEELKDFYKGNNLELVRKANGVSDYAIRNLSYTKIKINTSARALTQDLWINNTVPNKVMVYESIINHIVLWGLLIFIIISCLASLIAGIIVFRKNEPELTKFFFFGLFNFLTLIGFWLVSYLMSVERRFTDKKDGFYQEVKLNKARKVAIIIPLIILGILIILIPVSILLDLNEIYFRILMSFLFIIPLMPLLLFIPLIFWGYHKHRKALIFNVLFSVFFLVLLALCWFILTRII